MASAKPFNANGVVLRVARESDSLQLARLATQLGYPSTEGDIAARFARIRTEGAGEVLVAVNADDVVIAWTHVFLARRLESATFAEVGGLVVDESRRGAGIGEKLTRAAEEWAQARGAAILRVRSNIVRERAHHFYERLGYERAKTQAVFAKELGPAEGAADDGGGNAGAGRGGPYP